MKKALLILSLTTVLFSCEKLEDIFGPPPGKDFSGYIYTSTNSTSGNAIIALGRNSDGTVKELKGSPYSTTHVAPPMFFEAMEALLTPWESMLSIAGVEGF